jgi:hypothetical protein
MATQKWFLIVTNQRIYITVIPYILWCKNTNFFKILPSLTFPGAVVIVWYLDLQLPVTSVSITTKYVSSNPACDSMQHYVIKFVSDLQQVGGFLRVLRFPPPKKLTAMIWLKYLNTIALTLTMKRTWFLYVLSEYHGIFRDNPYAKNRTVIPWN